jgi:pimeloyl-ACP methyl ester carboxylesterase
VVCPDLRGYGQSSKPLTTADHAPYSKRAMADDCAALMRQLGHQQFCVAGHDRGAYVARRLAVDHPELVRRLCLYGDPLAVWHDWADDVRGQRIDCGHHMAEEAPYELAAQLAGFFAPGQ